MLTACAHCHRRFEVSDDSVGKAARCTYCGERFLIAPRDPDTIGLVGDDDELGRSLRLPTLEDIEEAAAPPDVGRVAPAPAGPPQPVPGIKEPERVNYLDSRQTMSVVLLLLCLAAMVAYGFWSADNLPQSLVDARSEGLAVSTDTWERVWRPLFVGSVTVLAIAGGLFWVGTQLSSRLLRVRYATLGVIESLAITAIPVVLPMLFALFAGSDGPGIRPIALAASLPVVCLLVPALFGMPMAKGLTAATVCIVLAAPGYLGAALWARDFTAQQVAHDDQRTARAITRLKREREEQPAAVPATLPSAAVTVTPVIVQEARQLANQVLPPSVSTVPQVPPAVATELDDHAATRVVTPAAAATESVANNAVAVASPQVAPELKSPLRPCRPIGSPDMIVWPSVNGTAFLCVRSDTFANHVVEVWSLDRLQRRSSLRLGGGANVSYAICPEGETLLRVVNGAAPSVELWSLADNTRRWQVPLSVGQAEPRVLGYFDKQTVGIVWRTAPDAAVDVVDLRRGVAKRTLNWPAANNGSGELTPENVVMTPDGKAIVVVDATQHLRLIDVATGSTRKQCLLNLPRNSGSEITQIVLSPDGTMVAVLVDETQSAGKSALFWGAVTDNDLASVSLAEPLWRQAGCARIAGRRVGHVMDWLSPSQVLLYGELVMDLQAGVIVGSVHPREAGRSPGPAASGQHRLPDGSFLLEWPADQQGKRPIVQRLPAEGIPQ